MAGLGYYQRRHIRQMEELRNSKIIWMDGSTDRKPLNIPCMGKACYCYGSVTCNRNKICNALF